MAKILDLDFRQGSLIEKVKGLVPNSNLNGSFIKSQKGLEFILNTSFTLGGYPVKDFLSGLNTVTFVAAIYENYIGRGSYGHVHFRNSTDASSTNIIQMYTEANAFYFYINIGSTLTRAATGSVKSRYKFIVVKYNGNETTNSNKVKISINGVDQVLTFTGTFPPSIPIVNRDKITMYDTVTSFPKGRNSFIKIYDHILSQKEIDADYKQFLNSRPTNTPIYFK